MPAPLAPATEYGRQVRELRDELGLTQVELATKIGVEQGTISAWERGAKLPSAALHERLEKVLGITQDVWWAEASSPKTWFADSPSDQRVYRFPVRAGRTEWQAA